MSIKVMIERKFKEPVTPEILRLIDEIRIKALRNRGYIGGETVVNLDDSREVLVISAWSNVKDWKDWYQTEHWKDLEKKLASRLEESPKIRIFMPGAIYEEEVLGK
ncbi:MAG: antibiotic biosynthesis monooxygenase [Deltaproteobacteria bacterium]|nr:antibiotic biosynthesis monooxygenase [Deltaproteobacteria bacterium]